MRLDLGMWAVHLWSLIREVTFKRMAGQDGRNHGNTGMKTPGAGSALGGMTHTQFS